MADKYVVRNEDGKEVVYREGTFVDIRIGEVQKGWDGSKTAYSLGETVRFEDDGKPFGSERVEFGKSQEISGSVNGQEGTFRNDNYWVPGSREHYGFTPDETPERSDRSSVSNQRGSSGGGYSGSFSDSSSHSRNVKKDPVKAQEPDGMGIIFFLECLAGIAGLFGWSGLEQGCYRHISDVHKTFSRPERAAHFAERGRDFGEAIRWNVKTGHSIGSGENYNRAEAIAMEHGMDGVLIEEYRALGEHARLAYFFECKGRLEEAVDEYTSAALLAGFGGYDYVELLRQGAEAALRVGDRPRALDMFKSVYDVHEVWRFEAGHGRSSISTSTAMYAETFKERIEALTGREFVSDTYDKMNAAIIEMANRMNSGFPAPRTG